MAARIVALGQEWAGDDGVGVAVIRSLRATLSPVPYSAVEETYLTSPLPHSVVEETFDSPSPTFSCGRGQGEGSDTLQTPIPASRRDSSERRSTAIDLIDAADPTQLINLLSDGTDPVGIIDAVLDEGPAGRVLLIDARSDPSSTHLLSTHGVGVLEAIELARIAHPTEVAQKIFIVGITIQLANRGGAGLSPPVSAVIPIASAQALKLAEKG